MILADRAFFIWLFRVSCEGVFTTEAQSSQSSEYFLISSGSIPRSLLRNGDSKSSHGSIFLTMTLSKVEWVKVCHSRMLLAGIQAKFGLDPR
jgi:hypothetical protein